MLPESVKKVSVNQGANETSIGSQEACDSSATNKTRDYRSLLNSFCLTSIFRILLAEYGLLREASLSSSCDLASISLPESVSKSSPRYHLLFDLLGCPSTCPPDEKERQSAELLSCLFCSLFLSNALLFARGQVYSLSDANLLWPFQLLRMTCRVLLAGTHILSSSFCILLTHMLFSSQTWRRLHSLCALMVEWSLAVTLTGVCYPSCRLGGGTIVGKQQKWPFRLHLSNIIPIPLSGMTPLVIAFVLHARAPLTYVVLVDDFESGLLYHSNLFFLPRLILEMDSSTIILWSSTLLKFSSFFCVSHLYPKSLSFDLHPVIAYLFFYSEKRR